MGRGNQVRGLIIASQRRGWDPTELIPMDGDPNIDYGMGASNGLVPPEKARNAERSTPHQQTITEQMPPMDDRNPPRKHTVGADPFVGKTGM